MDTVSCSPTFPLVVEMSEWKKKTKRFKLEDYFLFVEQPLFFLFCSPPSQPRVEHEESSIVSLLKQAAVMAARERRGGVRRGGSVYIPQPPPLLLLSASATLLLPFPPRGADRPCLLVSSLNEPCDALEAVWGAGEDPDNSDASKRSWEEKLKLSDSRYAKPQSVSQNSHSCLNQLCCWWVLQTPSSRRHQKASGCYVVFSSSFFIYFFIPTVTLCPWDFDNFFF